MQELFIKIILLGFAFLALFWTFTSPKKTFRNILLSVTQPRIWLTIFFQAVPVIQIILILTNIYNFSFSFGKSDAWIELFGFIICNAGILLAALAKAQMRSSWGAPGQHNIKLQKKLIISGPFTYSRNPIYLGLLLVFLGFEMVIRSYLIFLTLPLYLYMIYVIWTEEKLLEKYFGKSYQNYKHRVPRFFSLDNFLGI